MKFTSIGDRALVRLIPATYHKPPSLRGLIDSDDEMEILAEIEGLTSARLIAERDDAFGPESDARVVEVGPESGHAIELRAHRAVGVIDLPPAHVTDGIPEIPAQTCSLANAQ